MEERTCPKCHRKGTVIVGAEFKAGLIQRSLQCRVCRYAWTERPATLPFDPPKPLKRPDPRSH